MFSRDEKNMVVLLKIEKMFFFFFKFSSFNIIIITLLLFRVDDLIQSLIIGIYGSVLDQVGT